MEFHGEFRLDCFFGGYVLLLCLQKADSGIKMILWKYRQPFLSELLRLMIETDRIKTGRNNITRREFQDSYRRHYRMYKETVGNQKTRRLILFYSVECGLKSLLMKDLGKNTYEEFIECCGNEKRELKGHNISAMMKVLNPQNDYCLRNISLKRGGSVPPKQFNELWRYGAALADKEEEEKAEKTLVRIAEWIHTKL